MFHTIHASGETKHIVFCRKFLLNSRCLIIINFRNNRNGGGQNKKLYAESKARLVFNQILKEIIFHGDGNISSTLESGLWDQDTSI